VSTSSGAPGSVSLQTSVPFTIVTTPGVPMFVNVGSPANTRPLRVNAAWPSPRSTSALPSVTVQGAGVPWTHSTPTSHGFAVSPWWKSELGSGQSD
jgi:hypothetical protein